MKERVFCLPERYERNMYQDVKSAVEKRKRITLAADGKIPLAGRKKSRMTASRISSIEEIASTIETSVLQENSLTKLTAMQ